MTKNELFSVLKNEHVRFGRVNGFSFEPYGNGTLLKGRIPLTLAKKIREGVDTKKLQIAVHCGLWSDEPEKWATNVELADILSEIVTNLKAYPNAEEVYEKKKAEYIRQAELNGKLDDIYVLYFHIDTPEGVKHAINVIRQSGYVNLCLWDR